MAAHSSFWCAQEHCHSMVKVATSATMGEAVGDAVDEIAKVDQLPARTRPSDRQAWIH
jgi:hypothetical protein